MGYYERLFHPVSLAVAAVVFAVAFVALRRARLDSRRAVGIAGLATLLVSTIEYWLLGPASFVFWDEEGEIAPALYRYLLSLPPGARFAPAIGGGNDAYGMFASGGQHVLPEMWWLALMPVWLAIALHKAAIAAVAFVGAYLLCRRGAGASRPVALALACFYPFAFWYVVNVTYTHGLSYALIPLAVHVVAARADRGRYWPAAIALCIVLGIEGRPIHSTGAILGAIVFGAVALRRTDARSIRRIALALAVVLVVQLLNWHEVLYAMWSLAPLTARGTQYTVVERDILEVAAWFLKSFWSTFRLSTILYLLSIVILLATRPRWAAGHIAAIIGLYALTAAAALFPWRIAGLGALEAIDYGYTLIALPTLALLALAVAAQSLSTAHWTRAAAVAPAALLALGIASASWYKLHNAVQLLYYGGQRQYHAIENLAHRPWAPAEPFRVVTLRRRMPEPNVVAGFYGLETIDASINVIPAGLTRFWDHAIHRDVPATERGDIRLTLNWKFWDGARYAIDDHADLAAFGIANVRFVLSPVALRSAHAEAVSEPPPARAAWVQPAAADWRYWLARLRRIVSPGEIHVYRLTEALPRAYAARSVISVADDQSQHSLHETVLRHAPSRTIVVRARDASGLGAPQAALGVNDTRLVADGYDIDVDAPAGGIVVVNQVHVPFWRAWIDGAEAAIVPVNGIHMAVSVPPGAQSVALRYCRALLRETIGERLGARPACR